MFKLSQQPGCCRLNSRAVEEKITATWDISQYLPAWVKINSLASLNVRYTVVHNGGNAGND